MILRYSLQFKNVIVHVSSQDLLSICKELSLEDSLEELMEELGADSEGRISYDQFLQRRLALRPEIEAIKEAKLQDNASDVSQGKVDSWEWDSGARDMSPIPKSLVAKGQALGKFDEEIFKVSCVLFRLYWLLL